jgi:hypothetical protein
MAKSLLRATRFDPAPADLERPAQISRDKL